MRQLQKPLTWLGLIIGVVALVLQFVLAIEAYLAAGRDLLGALGAFFSYYTILTNIVLVLIYLSEMTSAKWLDAFGSLVTRGMMVAAMILVMTFVHFFLRGLTHLTGLALLADTLLHYVTPGHLPGLVAADRAARTAAPSPTCRRCWHRPSSTSSMCWRAVPGCRNTPTRCST